MVLQVTTAVVAMEAVAGMEVIATVIAMVAAVVVRANDGGSFARDLELLYLS